MQKLGDSEIRSLSQRMLVDYDAKNPGTVFAEGLRLSLDDAWKLQGAVAQRRQERGEQVVGYKIGCVCAHNQQANGLSHPVWGRLWSTEQHSDGARLRKDDFANVAIEGEFAITLRRDLPPEDRSPAAIVDAVERVFPVIELHNLVMRGEPPRGHELIANNAIHAGVVRGSGTSGPREACQTDLALIFDDEVVDSWQALRWPDDIVQAVSWVAEQVARDGQRLSAGDTLLTGAFGPPIPLHERTRIRVASTQFGEVEATIV